MEAMFTRVQADGAMPNGTRVVKIGSSPGDGHQDGAGATIIGSIKDPDFDRYLYFVEWDDMLGVPVGVASWRIARSPAGQPSGEPS